MTTGNPLVDDAIMLAEADVAVDELKESVEGAAKRSGERLPELSEAMGMESTTRMSPEADEMVTMYNRLDGTASSVPIYMLRAFLRRRFASENWIPAKFHRTRVFTTKASEAPVQAKGSIMCDFNPESPAFTYVVAAGVSHIACRKSNIPSEFEKRRHQKSYHQSASEAVEEYRALAIQSASDERMASLLERLVEREAPAEAPKAKMGRPKKVTDGSTE